jgi:hypothetical protein
MGKSDEALSGSGCLAVRIDSGDKWSLLSREVEQGEYRQRGIPRTLGHADQQQKPPQRLTHHPSHQGQRITDDRHPTEQQRPMTPAHVMAAGFFELLALTGNQRRSLKRSTERPSSQFTTEPSTLPRVAMPSSSQRL